MPRLEIPDTLKNMITCSLQKVQDINDEEMYVVLYEYGCEPVYIISKYLFEDRYVIHNIRNGEKTTFRY